MLPFRKYGGNCSFPFKQQDRQIKDALSAIPGDRVHRRRKQLEDRRRKIVRQRNPRHRKHDDRESQGYVPVKQRYQRRRIQGTVSVTHSVQPLISLGASIYDVHTEGEGRGVEKCCKFAVKQYRFCGQRGGRGSKNPKIPWTSYMEAPSHNLP